MPNAQVAIVTPRSIRRRRSWRRFLGRGTRALVPASCLSNGAADSQLGAELKTGLQFLALDYRRSARPSGLLPTEAAGLGLLVYRPISIEGTSGRKKYQKKTRIRVTSLCR